MADTDILPPKKIARTSAPHVRPRSPDHAHPSSIHSDTKAPAKRARKAINCEPCRNSKLKCDRRVSPSPLRPVVAPRLCSSARPPIADRQKPPVLVVRPQRSAAPLLCSRAPPCSPAHTISLAGTAAHCYQNQDLSSAHSRPDVLQSVVPALTPPAPALLTGPPHSPARSLDPSAEFSKIRQSLSLLESHLALAHRPSSIASAPGAPASAPLSYPFFSVPDPASTLPNPFLKQESLDPDFPPHASAPGARGRSGQGGFYAGPTSAVSHLSSSVGPALFSFRSLSPCSPPSAGRQRHRRCPRPRPLPVVLPRLPRHPPRLRRRPRPPRRAPP